MPGAGRPTPRSVDVARVAGVSQKTVSRVFNNEPYVSDAVRTRVLEAAERARKLGRFSAITLQARDGAEWFVARTGYTGEDGFEIVLPADRVAALWQALLGAGVKPAGLGARDTLRLEAGLNLYGQDMDESTTPLESGLAWTVSFDPGRDFIGRAALEAQRDAGVPRQLVGLVLDDKGVLRHGQAVATANGAGEILSGTFSPTLGKAIALARVPAGDPGEVSVDIRGRALPVRGHSLGRLQVPDRRTIGAEFNSLIHRRHEAAARGGLQGHADRRATRFAPSARRAGAPARP